MDSRQPFKKLRLSSDKSENCNNNQKTSNNVDPLNDDFGLWGEELELDDDVMQQIETQGYSQYQMQDSEKNNAHFTFNQENIATIQNTLRTNTDCINKSLIDGSSSQFPKNNDIPIAEPSISTVSNDVIKLREELLMKTGEVTNLRMEMKSREKEYYNQISEKNDVIAQLKRQLAGTQSEIEFQKLEMKSHKSKARLSLNNSKVMLKQSNLNSSFHEKFNFETNKNIQKDVKVFHFSRPTDKGDVLYKLLKSILNSDDPDFCSSQNLIKDEDSHGSDLIFEKNEFILHLKSSLLQLCWFSTFEEDRAVYLMKLIVTQSKELLTHFYQKLSCEELKLDIANRKSKFTLNRSKETPEFIDAQHFLKPTKLFPTEEGIFIRQTITMLAKLLEIEAKVVDMLIEPEPLQVARCSCISRENMNITGENATELTTSKFPEVKYAEKMEVDESSGSGDDDSGKNKFIFDVVKLLHDIVQEITLRGILSKYEGVVSSIFYLYSVLCDRNTSVIYEKQQILIINTIQKVLFGLPGFTVIQYILEFLCRSTQYSFTEALCCRSAAETFSENFRCYNFTKETCIFQVLSAYIEMAKKTPHFINTFTSWILFSTTVPHNVRWMKNKTESKFCECILMLEQITIKIMLNCVEQFNDSRTSSTDRLFLKTSLNRCVTIFKHFRWQDSDFDLHTVTCRGEYKLLLRSLSAIIDDEATKKFVSQEHRYLDEVQKYNLPLEVRENVIKSVLKMFSLDDYF